MNQAHSARTLVIALALFQTLPCALRVGSIAQAAQPGGDRPAVALGFPQHLLDRSSVLLIDVDLSAVDVASVVDWSVRSGLIDERSRPRELVTDMVSGLIKSMRTAGVQHVYVSVATRSASDGGPLMVIPCEDVASVEGTAAMLIKSSGADSLLQVRSQPNLVLVGPSSALDRLAAQASEFFSESRDDLLEPLGGGPRMDHVAVLAFAEAYRQELIAIWPDEFPVADGIQLSPRQMVEDIRRISVAWNLPPRPSIELKVEANSDAAAERVLESLQVILTHLATLASKRFGAASTAEMPRFERSGSAVRMNVSSGEVDGWVAKLWEELSLWEEPRVGDPMKQIGVAMHRYHEIHNHLPPKYFVNPDDEPLFSWLVAILPYLEQKALYESFNLGQPWDAPGNALPSGTVVPTYADVFGEDRKQTRFRLPVFPGSAWDGDGPPRSFREITDGTSNTIAAIHAPPEAAVAWADPTPWVVSPDDPVGDVFGKRDQATALFFDGSVRTLKRDEVDAKQLSAWLTIAGGEVAP